VLRYQKGNCFDFSTLLCSMLIGSGYDAYCVNGYGSLKLCHMDLTREVCPLTMKAKEVLPGACCPWQCKGCGSGCCQPSLKARDPALATWPQPHHQAAPW
jgi:hypothetical protein